MSWDEPLTRQESIRRLRWVGLVLLALVVIVALGFTLGVLVAIWL
jgi:hypothetical protein